MNAANVVEFMLHLTSEAAFSAQLTRNWFSSQIRGQWHQIWKDSRSGLPRIFKGGPYKWSWYLWQNSGHTK